MCKNLRVEDACFPRLYRVSKNLTGNGEDYAVPGDLGVVSCPFPTVSTLFSWLFYVFGEVMPIRYDGQASV